MEQFWPYLIGTHLHSWGYHEPLITFYNNMTKPSTARIKKHRQVVQDLSFTDKYLPGKTNPSDFTSRHPQNIRHLTQRQREEAGVDEGQKIHALRVLLKDLPEAVTVDMVKEAASLDPTYQWLMSALQRELRQAEIELENYSQVWGELGLVDRVVYRGDRIVLPDTESARDG